MMRDLTIKITADTAQAEAGLGRVDKSIENVGKSSSDSTKATDKMQFSLKSIAGVAAGFVALESVFQTFVSLGTEILRDADALSLMSDQTGIGVVQLQKLKGIADQSGNTIDQLASAITNMQNRLAEGDSSAVKAVQALGLSLNQLISQSPDEQFLSIARAVAQIENPAERTRLAMDLFGRAGAQILPSLRAEVDKIADSTATYSADTVRQLDAAGDAWTALWTKIKVFAASAIVDNSRSDYEAMMVRMGRAAELAEGSTGNLISAVDLLALHVKQMPVGDPLRVPGLPSADVIDASERATKKLSDTISPMAEKMNRQRQALADVATSLQAHTSALTANSLPNRQFEETLRREDPLLVALDQKLSRVTTSVQAWDQELPSVIRHMTDYAAVHEHAAESMTRLNNSLLTMPSRVRTAGEAYRQEMEGMGFSTDGLMGKIKNAFTNIPQFMGEMQSKLTGKLTQLFGASSDSVLGSVISGGLNFVFGPLGGLAAQLMQKGMEKLGELAWKGLKKIGGYFKDLFGGPDGKELAGRQVVELFETNIDGMLTEAQRMEAGTDEWKKTVIFLRDEYIKMGLSQEEALADAARLWNSSKDGAEAAARVIDEIKRKYSGGIQVPITFPTTVPDSQSYHSGGVIDHLPRAHRGLAIDEVPIVALRGEGVLNRGAMGRIGGAQGLSRLNQGGSMSSGSVTIENIVQLDGDVVYRNVKTRESRDLRTRQKMRAA